MRLPFCKTVTASFEGKDSGSQRFIPPSSKKNYDSLTHLRIKAAAGINLCADESS